MSWKWGAHFKPEEVLSPKGLEQFAKGNLLIQPFAMNLLFRFREWLALPICINHGDLHYRGYRSYSENEKVGGVEFSRHLQGLAFDMTVYKLTPEELARKMREFGRFGGIGIYAKANFCHGDFRPIMNGRIVEWRG